MSKVHFDFRCDAGYAGSAYIVSPDVKRNPKRENNLKYAVCVSCGHKRTMDWYLEPGGPCWKCRVSN